MHRIEDLNEDTYYLIRLSEDTPIQIVSLLLETKETYLLRSYIPSNEDFFLPKNTSIHEVIEELDETTALSFEKLYAEEEEDEEELFEFEEDDEE